ncbi:MAG TPA: hypothetical protein VFU02_15785 [Polyangiaceae bacterium]|nr:hypothetical protein [Polyangiaceae bacterium]
MSDLHPNDGSIDIDVAQSLREIERQRTIKTVGVVVGLAAVLTIGIVVVIAAYSDESDAVRDIKAAQPESNPAR